MNLMQDLVKRVTVRLILPGTLTALLLPASLFGETDLEVTYIERNPKYASYQDRVLYHINWTFYDDYLPYSIDFAYGLSGQNADTQRWPDDGETVTFTAHVYNRGTARVSSFDYQWLIDDVVVDSGTRSQPLGPGEFATFDVAWVWSFAPHRVEFRIDLPTDQHPSNNQVEDYTNALGLFTFIDYGYAAQFRQNTSQVANPSTDSITEWLQRHRERMNEMFEDAGSPLRWRYDRLDFVEDGQSLPPYDRANYDGNFPTRFRVGDGDLRLGGSGYYDAGEDLDYGLLHEIGHQLGIIDLYRLDVSPAQNEVNAQGYNTRPGLMHGVSPFICDHTAAAMAAWHGKRRGYFGQYLYDLPATIRLRFLSTQSNPLVGAQISAYQKIETNGIGERIPDTVKFSGFTDEDGVFTLPNVNVDDALFWNDVGNDLRPNPFGYISNHGENGVFLIKVEQNEFVDYVWFDITEANLAYWSGQTAVATFERQTAIGEGRQRFPPPDLAEFTASSWVSWAQDGQAITITDDVGFRRVGDASLRIDVAGGFDNYFRYPGDTLAQWDLSAVERVRLWCYALNPNLGFQSNSPWVRLGNYQDGYYQWRPSGEPLNSAIGQWIELVIPIAGNATWHRTQFGSPDLANVNYIEIHADTWDAGFTLWLDGVRFEPYPGPEPGDLNCDGAVDGADIDPFFLALVDREAYAAAYPDCDADTLGDINRDGSFDGADIDAFFALLGG